MHTPEPWHLADYLGDEKRYVVGPDNELIADCWPDSADDYSLPEDYRENANMIAAAPELYRALVQLVADIRDADPDWFTEECQGFNLAAAEAAIRKAVQP